MRSPPVTRSESPEEGWRNTGSDNACKQAVRRGWLRGWTPRQEEPYQRGLCWIAKYLSTASSLPSMSRVPFPTPSPQIKQGAATAAGEVSRCPPPYVTYPSASMRPLPPGLGGDFGQRFHQVDVWVLHVPLSPEVPLQEPLDGIHAGPPGTGLSRRRRAWSGADWRRFVPCKSGSSVGRPSERQVGHGGGWSSVGRPSEGQVGHGGPAGPCSLRGGKVLALALVVTAQEALPIVVIGCQALVAPLVAAYT